MKVTNKVKVINDSTLSKGGINFKLLSKNIWSGRDIVLIEAIDNKNNNESSKYIYYRSNSEVGLWRLCQYMPYYMNIIKGIDYITASLIDINIQNFINEKYQDLDTEGDIFNHCRINEKIYNFLNDPNRIVKDPIFETLSKCKSGECFKSKFTINTYINNLSDQGYDNELKKLLCKTEDNCNNILDKNIKLMEQIKGIFNSISKFIEKYFKIIDKPAYIGKNTVKYDNTTISHNFYSVTIRNKEINKEYKLVYSKYMFEKVYQGTLSPFSGEYRAIINIVPKDEKLSIYGVNNEIISAGVYIYKILEYKQQCNIEDKDRSIPVNNKDCYIFIGDFMTNVFPLNKVKEKYYFIIK